MIKEFNASYPQMRPLKREVYGKLIFLAGIENNHHMEQALAGGVRDILVSYYYLRNKNKDMLGDMFNKFDNVVLDSGAYTFIQKMVRGQTISNESIKAYTDDYLAFVFEMKHHFNWVFENDMTWQVGDTYRNEHIAIMAHNGIRVVPVVHKDKMIRLKEFGYFDDHVQIVALAGDLTGGAAGPSMPLIKELISKGKFVHGLAATDVASINRVPYFSVDSSSWLTGSRWGHTYVFDRKMTVYESTEKARVRRQYEEYFKQGGVDTDKLLLDDAGAVNHSSAYSWQKYIESVQYVTAYSYWLTDKEIAEAKDLLRAQLGVETTDTAVDRFNEEVKKAPSRRPDLNSLIPADAGRYTDVRSTAPIMCDTCLQIAVCPAYESGANCYYNQMFKVESLDDVRGVSGGLIAMQYSRANHALLIERQNGGVPDPMTSKEINLANKLLKTAGDLFKIKEDPEAFSGSGGGKKKATVLKALFEEVEDDEDEEKESSKEKRSSYNSPDFDDLSKYR